jgi:hypothetical protein
VERHVPVGAILLGAALLLALLLAFPGETVTTAYVNDLFIFLDGAHRIAWGQVPNRDFHTALGPLSFYIPALGYWLSGHMGGAMPTGIAASTLALALPMAHILNSRLRPLIALPLGLFLLLIAAVPLNLGEGISSLSFAMFYNRIGWAVLSTLLVMYLQPERISAHQDLLDALCATGLTLVLLFLKVTYGLVAMAFVIFMLFDSRQRRWAAAASALIFVGCLVIEAFWQSSRAYLDDLRVTGDVSGGLAIADLVDTFRRHLLDYTCFALFAVLALWRTRSTRHFLFFGFCAGAGLLIQKQNSEAWGIIALFAGASVAMEIMLRSQRQASQDNRSFGYRKALLLLALLVPLSLYTLMGIGLHAVLAATRTGEPFGLPRFDRVRLTSLWVPGDRTFISDYLVSVRDGARLLSELPMKPQRVSVVDFVNPFSAGLDLPAARRLCLAPLGAEHQ